MITKTNSINDSRFRYRSPEIKVITFTMHSILCQSENRSMYEKDYGDGGFEEQ